MIPCVEHESADALVSIRDHGRHRSLHSPRASNGLATIQCDLRGIPRMYGVVASPAHARPLRDQLTHDVQVVPYLQAAALK